MGVNRESTLLTGLEDLGIARSVGAIVALRLATIERGACVMRVKSCAVSIVTLILGCAVMFAPVAAAKPKPKPAKALPFRGCAGLLPDEDFPGAVVEEPPTKSVRDGIEISVCTFATFKPEDAGAHILECTTEPTSAMCTHRGGNDSLVVADAALYAKHPQAGRRRGWPAGFTRKRFPGIGTNAEYGVNDSPSPLFGAKQPVAFGWLQVRNDTFEVESERASVFALKQVASELCHECK
jgi:hypothetical protein